MRNEDLLDMMIAAGKAVRENVYNSLRTTATERLRAVHAENKEDTIYVIDREVEDVMLPVIARVAHQAGGIVVLAEGIGEENGGLMLPEGSDPSTARYRLLIDPIDGTRGIMYNKRSAFFLAGLAPNRGTATRLSDIFISVMVELPTSRHFLSDVLWAVRGHGSFCETDNLLTGQTEKKSLTPSGASTIIGGFAQLTRFFPPGRDLLSKIEDELIETIQPDNPSGKALVFEDQYISSGGQLFEMLNGHDRFIADVRGLLYKQLRLQGKQGGHVCHPYDVAAHLIGSEAGVIITDGNGAPLDAPLDLNSEINWVGYANNDIQRQVQPILDGLLKKYKLT